MKKTITLTVAWLLGTLLLLAWLLYAVTDFGAKSMMPSDARAEAQAARERARALSAALRDARTFEEAVANRTQEATELQRWADLLAAERTKRALVQRAFALWFFMAIVPLAFLWWRHVRTCLRGLQTSVTREPEAAVPKRV